MCVCPLFLFRISVRLNCVSSFFSDTGEREMSSALVGPNHDVSGSAVSLVKSHVKATLDTIRTISSLGMIVLNCHHRKSTGLESDTVLLETQEKIEGTFKTEHEVSKLNRVQILC